MKTLTANGLKIEGSKIIKTIDSIIVLDANSKEIFKANGISDFSQYSLEEEQTFDVEDNLEEATVKEVANLKLDLMKKNTIITGALNSIADLKVEIMSLKGAN